MGTGEAIQQSPVWRARATARHVTATGIPSAACSRTLSAYIIFPGRIVCKGPPPLGAAPHLLLQHPDPRLGLSPFGVIPTVLPDLYRPRHSGTAPCADMTPQYRGGRRSAGTVHSPSIDAFRATELGFQEREVEATDSGVDPAPTRRARLRVLRQGARVRRRRRRGTGAYP